MASVVKIEIFYKDLFLKYLIQRYDFVDPSCYLYFFVFVMLSCLLLAALRSPAGKGLTSWFSYV